MGSYQDKQRQEEAMTLILFTSLIQELFVEHIVMFLFLFCSNVQGDSQTSICITIEPGLLLKGDILVRNLRLLASFGEVVQVQRISSDICVY